MTRQPAPARLSGIAYLPRWLGGTLCYIVFGLGGLLSSLTILPILRFWPGTTTQRIERVQYAVHIMFKGFVHMLTWAGLIKVSHGDLQQLQDAKGIIVTSNHPTLVDVVVLISLMPNTSCIVKQGIWRNPFMRGVVSSAGYIPNRGAELLLADCKEVLNRGNNLIIFPEGTRTVIGKRVNNFARGAANITIRTQSDLLPLLLKTNCVGFSKQESWYQLPRRTIGMHIEVGEKLPYLRYDATAGGDAKMARQMTRDLEEYYKQQLDKYL
ncbi:1-acyl-sn-glycerol-3-phosphate acyltransferase [Shewanella sp. c952]|nr:1-acyl-sn-glycerol-3-phosphate acyltransferase [Shewanella sp. c952]